jgi:uncharacterized protein (DUF1697 family)
MKTYIALFRGINVGGRNSLPMKELVTILQSLGAQDVRTYIQSGNAVFRAKEQNGARLSRRISTAIEQQRGFEPHVLLLALEDLQRIIDENLFPEAATDPRTLHVGFLASKPASPKLAVLDSLKRDTERYQLGDRAFYLHAPEGIGRSKLAANAERLLGVPMTDRNWRTVCTIREMATALTATEIRR